MVNISKLGFAYGTKRKLFDELDLTIAPGNIYGLLGKNGAGKTTLLRIIAGALYPKTGSCSVFGTDSCKRDAGALSDIYFLPEEPVAPPCKCREYLNVYAAFYPRFCRNTFERIATEWKIRTDQSIATLSQGERKKFFIAFALSTKCRLILMDEPSNGLDIPSKTIFRKLIAGAADEQGALIISSHQVRDLEGLIDPIIIIDNGKMILNENVADIEDKIVFSLGQSVPQTAEVLYSMQVPAGWAYATVKTTFDDYGNKADLELLFNAATEQPQRIQHLFGNGVK